MRRNVILNIRYLVASTALVLAGGLMLSEAGSAKASIKQSNCVKAKAKVKKAKGAKKRIAKLALTQCRNNLAISRQITNTRITGYRADGLLVDDLYCAKGKWQSDVGQGGRSYSTGWIVESSQMKSAKRYTAVIVGKVPGGTHEISIGRNGNKWQVGWVSFDEPKDLGDATLTKAAKDCRKIK